MSKFERVLVGFLFVFCLANAGFAATYTVTKIADTADGTCDADCSLREAIAAANATSDNDVIEFSSLFATAQTITLGGTDLIINNAGSLVINGSGADLLTVSGNSVSRVFSNNTGAVTTINNLRVTGGTGVSTVVTGRGGGVYNNGGTLTLNNLIISGNTAANGGGANNAGTATLNINNCILSNNTATGAGGALQNFAGNTTNIRNSAIHNNTSQSTGTGGGAMQANGVVNISNTTFAANTATGGSGGAIFYNGTGLVMTNVTISGNTATNNGGGIHKSTSTLNAFFRNNIIAGNNGVSTSPDITGAFNSNGNNIVGNVGTSTGWIGSDLINTDPTLGAFGNNGGFGNTFLPLAGSPAINAGQNCVVDLSCSANNPPTAVTTDQRGIARPQGATVDIGAVEVAAVANVTVSGRVASLSGASIANAIVTISSGSTVVQSVKSNSFGNFTFTNIADGQTYTINVIAKSYAFTPQNVNVSGNTTGVVITANGNSIAK